MPMLSEKSKPERKGQLTVYFDGACPKCLRDRALYEKLAGQASEQVCWFDITDQASRLKEMGIDPQMALSELHVVDAEGRVVSEMDAYIMLMNKVPLLKPVGWLIGSPFIRPFLARLYHYTVSRRLQNRGINLR